MNQWYAKKRHVFVLLTLVGAILMGLFWLAGVPGSASAQGTLLLNTSYKDATPRKVGAGGTVAYSIVLNNDTLSTTTGIEVNDPLASELTYVSQSASVIPEDAGFGFFSGGRVQFTVFPIAPGGTVTLLFQATVATTVLPEDIITNTATITEGGLAFTRFVTVTVEDYPSAQINEPWNNQLFTGRGTFTVKGRTWNGDHPAFPEPPVLAFISNGGGANDWYTVSWDPISGAVAYILQESTDPYFSQIRNEYTVTGVSSKYIDNQPRGRTYYYRAKVRTAVYESRWSAAQAVTVNLAGLLFQPLDAAPVVPSVAPLAAAIAPTVELNIKKVGVVTDTWQQATTIMPDPTGDWWNWTYAWTLPTEDDAQYMIEVRAKGSSGGYDATKNDVIMVTIRNGTRFLYLPMVMRRYPPIPYAPTLAVPSNDTHGTYQLSWTYNYPGDPYPPTSYTLQEATNANFTTPTEETLSSTTLSRSYTNKAVGTYYYRVRGNNTYGAGQWSNVQTVVVTPRGFFDDFSNAGSGWPRKVYSLDGRAVLDANYDSNNYYRMKILLNKDGLNNKFMGLLPAPYTHSDRTYDVQVVHRFVKAVDEGGYAPMQGKAGLVFLGTRTDGGTGYLQTFHTVEWNFEGRCSISGYTNYPTDFGHDPYIPRAFLPRGDNDRFVYRAWGGWNDPACPGLVAGYDKDMTVRVEVRGDTFSVFFNNSFVGTYTFWSGLPGNPHLGLITGSWEVTPVQSRFDNFRVTDK